MAEIKIEKKKPVWPWIIAILVIAAIIYFIFCTDHQVQSTSSTQIENTTSVDSTSN